MNPMDFDALLTINQGFNTLNDLAESNAVKSMSQQTMQGIQTMQTPMPQGHLPQHVVLPMFQNQPQAAPSTSAAAEQFFAVVNGAQKGPFTLEQIKGLAIADVIDENTQVWMPGLPSWVDLKTCLANLKK